MAEGGYDRLPDWNFDIPDDDNADETTPFFPNGASTLAPEFQTIKMKKTGFLNFLKLLKIF